VRPTRLLAAAVAAVALAVGASPAAMAQSFGVRPGHYDPADPATRAYFKPVIAPGATFSDEVVVTNTGDEPLTFFVSGVDGLTAQTTGAVYANRQDKPTETGTWIETSASELTVAPRSEAALPFTVRVPADAAPGDHLGGVAFENAAPQSSGSNIRITQVVRAVVGVSVRVPGPAEMVLRVGDLRLRRQDGTGTVAAFLRLANDGRALGKPDLSVTLSGPDGYRRTVERRLDTVLPGDEVDYPLAWPDDLAPGRYRITAVATGPGTRADADEVVYYEVDPDELSVDASPAALSTPGVVGPPSGGIGTPSDGIGTSTSAAPPSPPRSTAAERRSGGWVDRIEELLRRAGQVVAVVAREAAFPLGLALLGLVFLVVQDRIDRRDPKLALAPVNRPRDLPFPPASPER
jgi:hypothetical protein